MPFIEFNETLKTNVALCDQQHQKLVALINDLHQAMKSGKGKEVIFQILSELVAYTDYHFKTEEDYFRKYAYPEALAHQKEHQELTETALALKSKVEKGESVITIEVMNFLKNWLNNHILKTDKKYGPYLNAKGVF